MKNRNEPMKTGGYEICRYLTPSSLLTDLHTTKAAARARRRAMHIEPLTYNDLLAKQTYLLSICELNAQTAANRATALRAFLRANLVQLDDVVGAEMRTRYPESVERLIKVLRDQEKGQRSITNTRSAVRPWREMVVEDDTTRAHASDKLAPFNAAFKSIVEGHPIKRIAKQAGVSHDMMFGWLLGKAPRASSARFIRRIEAFFALPQESLVMLAGISGNSRIRPQVGVATEIEYRRQLPGRTSDRYLLVPPENSPLRKEWAALVRYKTARVSTLERGDGGRWSHSPNTVERQTGKNWWCFDGQLEVPSARIAWMKTASYLGWLSLAPEKGGAGVPVEQTQSLAWYAVSERVGQYLDWLQVRGGGKRSGLTFEFIATVIWMTRPGDGYIFQHPAMLQALPAEFQELSWKTLCQQQHTYCRKLRNSFEEEREVSRNPFEPIQHIIDLAEPLEPIADMVQRMRQDRPVGCDFSEALWSRDILLIKLLVSNPLRLRNLQTLTWRADNKGNLYQRVDGTWWIKIANRYFKNRRGTSKKKDYDAPVHESVWSDLERYVLIHRSRLLRHSSDLLFLAKSNRGDVEHRPWPSLGGQVLRITRKYLWRCDGIRTHAFRHIVATSILKAEGGDIKTAALVLNDSEATVFQAYSGMRSSDGAVRMGQLLGKTMRRM